MYWDDKHKRDLAIFESSTGVSLALVSFQIANLWFLVYAPGSEEANRFLQWQELIPYVPQYICDTSTVPIFNTSMAYLHILRGMPSATLETLHLILRASLPKESEIPDTIRKVIIALEHEKDQRAHAAQIRRELEVRYRNGGPFFPFPRLTISYIGQASPARIVSDDGATTLSTTEYDADVETEEMPELMEF